MISLAKTCTSVKLPARSLHFFCFGLFLIGILVRGGPLYSEVRTTPDDRVLAIGEISEPLPLDVLIRAAFIASGTKDNELDRDVETVLKIIDSLDSLSSFDMARRGEAVLEWMHENLLRRYAEFQTSLTILLEKGTYNCVSSAVLYMLLSRGVGIPVHGVLTKDHAFCHIPVTGRSGGIDVETTTKHGFDAQSRKLARDSFTRRTGFVYVPAGKQRKDIGEKELISLIYQNRISVLQKSGHWEEVVGLSLDRWLLAKSKAAMNDYKLSVRNYAIYLNRQKRHVQGLDFLNDASRTLSGDHGFEDIASVLLGNAVVLNLRENHIEEALKLLEDENLSALIPENFLADRRREIMKFELGNTLESVKDEPSFHLALSDLDEALASKIIDVAKWEEFVVFLWSGEVQRRSVGEDWLRGWLFLKTAPESVRVIPKWKDLEATYEYNSIITFHNRFVAALRQRRIDVAGRILNEALKLFPDSPVLFADKKLLAEEQ